MKKISLLALLCSLVLLFAACGDTTTPEPGTDTGTDTATTDTGEDTDGGTDGATDGGSEDTGTTDGTDGTDGTTDGTDGTDGGTTPPAPVAGVCETADTPAAETTIEFGDARIETAAKASLADVGVTVGEEEQINCEQILQLLGVTVIGEAGANGVPLPSSDLDSLVGLENATSLATLEVNKQDLEDLAPIGGLTSLTELYVPNNEITDISVLANLESLRLVYLSFNRNLTDIEVLKGLEWDGANDDVRLQGTRVTPEDAQALVDAGVETVQAADGTFIAGSEDGGGATTGEEDGGGATTGEEDGGGATTGEEDGGGATTGEEDGGTT